MKALIRRWGFPLWCALVAAGYAAATVRGWGGTPAKDGLKVPEASRNDPDYYRRSLFSRGGK